MEPIFTIIKQDLEVAEKSIDKNDFALVSIIGNRIMSNVLTANKTDLLLLGLIVRDLGFDLSWIEIKNKNIKDKSKPKNKSPKAELYLELNTAKEISKNCLVLIEDEIARGHIDAISFYNKYEILESQLRLFLLSDCEKTSYDDQPEYSRLFAINSIDMFYSFRAVLFAGNNNLIQSIAGELSRNYNEHGGKEALMVYFVFKLFLDFYKYVQIELFFSESQNMIWNTKDKLNEYSELIYKFRSHLIDGKIDIINNAFNEIITRIGVDFRIYYLNYGDITIRTQGEAPRKAKIELPKEAKQKIGDIIAKSLQSE